MTGEATLRIRRDENGTRGTENEDSGEEEHGSSGDRSENENNANENMEQEDLKEEKASIPAILARFTLCLAVGFIFGFVLEKGRVFEPRNVRGQMVFKKLIYSKCMTSAMASGMFGLALMAMIPSTYNQFQRVCIRFYGNLADKGIMACGIGGIIMGVGITLAGSCPLLTFVQIGAKLPNAYYTLGGAMLGTLIFGIMKPLINPIIRPFFRSSSNPWTESSYFVTALPLVAMFAMLCFAFDLLVPLETEIKLRNRADASYVDQRLWHPIISGVIVGLLQIPLVLWGGQTLEGSSSYATIISQVLIGPFRRLAPSLSQYRGGLRNWSQVFFVLGTVLGAYTSASFSSSLALAKGVPVSHAIIGGFLMAYGAQMAGGSTNLHGQTGMGLLSILSFITMACLASGSIITAIIMKRLQILTPK